jgi:thymidylate synthase
MLKNAVKLNKYKNQDINSDQHEEYQYLNLLHDILEDGSEVVGRNGTTKAVYGAAMHFTLTNNTLPLLTTKKVAWKTCLKELLWFIAGHTDNNLLNQQNVHIWDGNATPEFMKSRGLEHYPPGDLGPLYGFQWRHFNATYHGCQADYSKKGIDQLQDVIDCLKDPVKRNSRRMIVSAWNPSFLDQMALPPCHVLFQFNVLDGNKLSCSLYQRSVDEFLGNSFNIASYSMLTHLVAHHCGLEPYEFIHYSGNCHLYDDHYEQAREQLTRTPYPFPKLKIVEKRESIQDYQVTDFVIENYQHHSVLKGAMRA